MLWLLPGFEFVAAATKTAVGNSAESDSLNSHLSSLLSKTGRLNGSKYHLSAIKKMIKALRCCILSCTNIKTGFICTSGSILSQMQPF